LLKTRPEMNSTLTTEQAQANKGYWGDILITVLALFASLIILLSIPLVAFLRNWDPIKHKQPLVVILTAIGGSFFITASILNDNHWSVYPGQFFGICPLWTFWFGLVLGLGLWVSALIVRPLRLFLIIHYKLRVKDYHTVLMVCGLDIPFVIYAIVATVAEGFQIDPEKDICKNDGIFWTLTIFFLVALYIVVFLGMTVLMWWIKRSGITKKYINTFYYEYTLIKIGAGICILLAIANAFSWGAKQIWDVSVPIKMVTRFVLTFSIIVGISFFYWSPLVKPIWGLISGKEDYTTNYVQSLKQARTDHVSQQTSKETEDTGYSAYDDSVATPRTPLEKRESIVVPPADIATNQQADIEALTESSSSSSSLPE